MHWGFHLTYFVDYNSALSKEYGDAKIPQLLEYLVPVQVCNNAISFFLKGGVAFLQLKNNLHKHFQNKGYWQILEQKKK